MHRGDTSLSRSHTDKFKLAEEVRVDKGDTSLSSSHTDKLKLAKDVSVVLVVLVVLKCRVTLVLIPTGQV